MRWENHASGVVAGPVTQVGEVHGSVFVNSGHAVRTHYHKQVERLAPRELVGRSAELAELADFCTSPTTAGRYAWWRADAWSGKSALLSWFVLHPPPGTRLVSFFITNRLAGQNDRHAFVDNVLDQLLAFLGEPMPANLTASTREGHLQSLLCDVAERCAQRAEHFALVVDGLDEDSGVNGDPDAHSIAALLPFDPPNGMRVIVAGRPNPPIPYDVPDDHPLRDPAIIRPLAPSAEARAVREVMERDLKRLYGGAPNDQALLGLLVSAEGGLATSDLAELAGISEWQVVESLGTVTGRNFVSRGGGPLAIHQVAHEELRATAARMLGPSVDAYRESLHGWAEGYRDRDWPPDTPEYLLTGYFAMLVATGDLPRMMACATDLHRRNRMRSLTGGDGAAIAEILATQEAVVGQDEVDVIGLARLAVHRADLYRSTNRIPRTLPTGWARIGDFGRAESMINAIEDPADRVEALTSTAVLAHGLGDEQRAQDLLERAYELARTLSQFFGAWPLHSVAMAFAATGRHDRAGEAVEDVLNDSDRAEVLASLVIRAAAGGDLPRAAELLEAAKDLAYADEYTTQASALAEVARATAKTGDLATASLLLDDIESQVEATPDVHVDSAGPIARLAATVGDHDRALRLLDLIDEPDSREFWTLVIITVIAEGDPDRAETVARTTDGAESLCARLSAVARVVAKAPGGALHAGRLIARIEDIARQAAVGESSSRAYLRMAEIMAITGDLDGAETIARRHGPSSRDADAVLNIAAAALRANDLERGATLLTLAEHVARADLNPDDERRSVLWVRTLSDTGQFDRAEVWAGSMRDRSARSAAWAVVAEGATVANQIERGVAALGRIEETRFQRRPRLELVRVLAASGDYERAESLARVAHDPVDAVVALILVSEAARAGELLDSADEVVDSMTASADQLHALSALLMAAAMIGDRARTTALSDRVRSLAETIIERGIEAGGARNSMAESVLREVPTRTRTLTEVVEGITRSQVLTGRDQGGDHMTVVPGRWTPGRAAVELPPEQAHVRDLVELAPEQALIRDLVELDWYHVVEDLVDLHPEAYPVILAELDLLAER
ncbi:tetratricopeptide repeat protein [Umezawaea endophytica]|uniref:Uncharacterized protein n=1 Tax=Umezawaea endophytica TaxID=1654476 RepID=A0A9X2VQH8_9PSEU|nr:hypothetical protein [Umezawaea endophytica]MCS7480981.1 hypothetical protein [Umezawaea endophytica]